LKTLVFFICLLFVSPVFGQESVADALALYKNGKLNEAYDLLNSEKLKVLPGEETMADLVNAFVCKDLYKQDTMLNSLFRNNGIQYAAKALEGKDTSLYKQARAVMKFLTNSLYNDLIPVFYKEVSDSTLKLYEVEDKTLKAFLHFPISVSYDYKTLNFIGCAFYNDGVKMLDDVDPETPLGQLANDIDRVQLLFQNAYRFFDLCCSQYNKYCDVKEMIRKGIEK
jgi:hypothetical protein